MLVEHLRLQFAEGVLLRDKAPGALHIAGGEHRAGELQIVVDDGAEIVERGHFLGREGDLLAGLGLDAVGEVQLDHVARVLEVRDVERELEGAARFLRRELLLREVGEIGLKLRLVGVEAVIHGAKLLQLLGGAGLERVERGIEHALQQFRHAHGFEQHVGQRHGGRLRRLGVEVARAGKAVTLTRRLRQDAFHQACHERRERQKDEADRDVEAGMEGDGGFHRPEGQHLHQRRDATDEGEAQYGTDAAAGEVGERQPARHRGLGQRGRNGRKAAAEIGAEDEGQRPFDAQTAAGEK